jgi:hypothetical protein
MSIRKKIRRNKASVITNKKKQSALPAKNRRAEISAAIKALKSVLDELESAQKGLERETQAMLASQKKFDTKVRSLAKSGDYSKLRDATREQGIALARLIGILIEAEGLRQFLTTSTPSEFRDDQAHLQWAETVFDALIFVQKGAAQDKAIQKTRQVLADYRQNVGDRASILTRYGNNKRVWILANQIAAAYLRLDAIPLSAKD